MKRNLIVLLTIVILAHTAFLNAEEAIHLSDFERMPVPSSPLGDPGLLDILNCFGFRNFFENFS